MFSGFIDLAELGVCVGQQRMDRRIFSDFRRHRIQFQQGFGVPTVIEQKFGANALEFHRARPLSNSQIDPLGRQGLLEPTDASKLGEDFVSPWGDCGDSLQVRGCAGVVLLSDRQERGDKFGLGVLRGVFSESVQKIVDASAKANLLIAGGEQGPQ